MGKFKMKTFSFYLYANILLQAVKESCILSTVFCFQNLFLLGLAIEKIDFSLNRKSVGFDLFVLQVLSSLLS